jgi:hypothetical protein
MNKVKIYRFTKYSIQSDGNEKSRRWGTREAIEGIGGKVIEDTETEVDETVVASDIDGFTAINFDPHPRPGFQTQVYAWPRAV